ncbi:MAG: outer membrane beta-barrel protein [Pseudomonadota bacterium]
MFKSFKHLVMGALLVLACAPAASAEMYFGVYGGGAVMPDSEQRLWDPPAGAPAALGMAQRKYDPAASFGLKLGGWLAKRPYLALEGNVWGNLGGLEETFTSGIKLGNDPWVLFRASSAYDLHLVNFSLSPLLQYPGEKWRFYGGPGLLYSAATASIDGHDIDKNGLGYTVQAGVEYKVTPKVGVFTEYRWAWADYGDGFVEKNLGVHNSILGVAAHF